MGLNCACPPAASLESFTVPKCLESFGQVNKVIFQRITESDGVKNVISTDISKKATWTPLFAASDGTKTLISPFVSNPTTTPGDKKTYGGGNATPGGVIKVIGSEPTTFEAQMEDMQQSTIASMKKLMCEEVGVYLINERGDIACLATKSGEPETTEYRPIPITSLFIGDKGLGGLDNPDSNAIEWSFKPNWSDELVIVKTEFDALTELTNV